MVNHTCKEDSSRFPLVIFSLFGLSFFDILYVAVVITYVSQNQLIQYYINSIIDKVRGKAYTLDDAVKVGGYMLAIAFKVNFHYHPLQCYPLRQRGGCGCEPLWCLVTPTILGICVEQAKEPSSKGCGEDSACLLNAYCKTRDLEITYPVRLFKVLLC